MKSTRIKTLAIGLGLAFLLPTGNALAGAGDLAKDITVFAHEIATDTTDLTNLDQVYTMGIDRAVGQTFIIRYTLSAGEFFSTPAVPVVLNGGAATVTFRSGGEGEVDAEYDVDVTSALTGGDTGTTLTLTAPVITFPKGNSVGDKIRLTVDLRDTSGALDTSGRKTQDMAFLDAAAVMKAPAASTGPDDQTTVNVNAVPPRTLFLVTGDDRTGVARVELNISDRNSNGGPDDNKIVNDKTGAAVYTLDAGDEVTITITGDFTGLDGSNFCYDLDSGSSGDTIDCDSAPTNEKFIIVGNTATLVVEGDDLGDDDVIVFAKEPGVVLEAPRTFGVSATIAPASGTSQNRSIDTPSAAFWQWQLNGAVLTANYIAFIAGNETKFRFTNTSGKDFLVFPEIVLDQGTFTLSTTGDFGPLGEFNVPAGSNVHLELDNVPAADTGAIGPLVTLTSGQQPVRGRAVFTALTDDKNVTGAVLIASPAGVITVITMEEK